MVAFPRAQLRRVRDPLCSQHARLDPDLLQEGGAPCGSSADLWRAAGRLLLLGAAPLKRAQERSQTLLGPEAARSGQSWSGHMERQVSGAGAVDPAQWVHP